MTIEWCEKDIGTCESLILMMILTKPYERVKKMYLVAHRRLYSIIFGILSIILLTTQLFCTDLPDIEQPFASQRSPLWLDFGGGINLLGWSAGLSLSLPLEGHLISLRTIQNSQLMITKDDYIDLDDIINLIAIFPMIQLADAIGAKDTSIGEYGLLYGRYWDGEKTHVSLSGGLSYVKGKYLPFHEIDGHNKTISTVGLPLEVKLFYFPRSSFEFGYYIFGNINRDRSYAGCLLNFRIGRTR